MDALLGAAEWVVGKALARVADGVLQAWAASSSLGGNIEAVKMELLLVKATLELASGKQISGNAMEQLLQMMRDSAEKAVNLLDELDYFHCTYDATAHHGECLHRLCQLLSCPSSQQAQAQAHDDDAGQSTLSGSPQIEHAEEAPRLMFDRVEFSRRSKDIVEQLQPVRMEVTKILQACDRRTVQDIAQIRPVITGQIMEPIDTYRKDDLVSNIIRDVTKVLAPLANGTLEAWGATNYLGLNIKALRMELLLVQATLETASHKQICGPAMEELLGNLRDSAHKAGNLIDELVYFRTQDELHGPSVAVDNHAKDGVHDLVPDVRRTTKSVGKLSCLPSGCMPKLGQFLSCSSSPHAHDDDSGKSPLSGSPQIEHAEEAPMLMFDRVDFSRRMKDIVEQLWPVRMEVTKILQSCHSKIVEHIAQRNPVITGQIMEPRLYRRDDLVSNIIHDVAKVLAPLSDGLLEAWDTTKNFDLNIKALRMELLLVQATLETASRKLIGGAAMEDLLGKLRDSAQNAGNLVDELDYFRIQDELHDTSDAANYHESVGKLACLPACCSAASPGKPGEVQDATAVCAYGRYPDSSEL
ncbi:uncharacterized protein [Triticum aestivum]|uniref:uncharacterized protein isoform X2 n=1 Tax=Triticum aestivum TaxID=4565 RepID=UPI001D00CCB0|nr:uncharacterized protein LOC123039811 isoform X2 [Triticum aestivum]